MSESKTPRTDGEKITGTYIRTWWPDETTTETSPRRAECIASFVPVKFARQLETELNEARESEIMKLAAISTASLQNSEKTVKDRISADNPYYSTAYQDVCDAVDREITLRVSIDRKNAVIAQCLEALESANFAVKIIGFTGGNIQKKIDEAIEAARNEIKEGGE